MKKTLEFRYYRNKHGIWCIDRKFLLFCFIPIWMSFHMMNSRFYNEAEVVEEINETIHSEKEITNHKNEYRLVNEDTFKK